MDRFAAMETFVRVVDTGSFSAAARQLNLGQPAISKTIAHLEERLGVRLLMRSTRGLSATEAGLRFYERARRALDEAEEADLAARGEGGGLTGLLRVSGATTFTRIHVIPKLGAFSSAHPDLHVEMVLDDRVIDLVEEGIDLALRMGDLADSTATARRLATSPRSVFATPAYLARRGSPQTPAELVDHDAILYTQGRFASWVFRNGTRDVSVAVSGRLRLSSAEATRAAVLADLGLTIASDWMFSPELASGAVVKVLPDWQIPSIDLWALFPSGRLASAKARAFAEFVSGVLHAPA